jgi:predicted AAA+ superfamily ATPase
MRVRRSPEVVGLERHLRIKIHQEYFHAVLFRDLVERHDVSHPNAVVDLAHKLIDNTASLYSINSLTGYLKSRGHKAPKSAVSDYLTWFNDAYFLFTVRLFDASLSRSAANSKARNGSPTTPRPAPARSDQTIATTHYSRTAEEKDSWKVRASPSN